MKKPYFIDKSYFNDKAKDLQTRLTQKALDLVSSNARSRARNRSSGDCDVLLIQPPYQSRKGSGVTIPLGLAYLASYIRSQGFIPKIIDCAPAFNSMERYNKGEFEGWVSTMIRAIRPVLAVGIGPSMSSTIRSTVQISKLLKKIYPDLPLVYGGPLASISGQEWVFFEELGASAIIKGDGEIALANLLKTLQKGDDISTVEGVVTSLNQKMNCNVIENLDQLPFPARDLFDPRNYFPSVRRNLFKFPSATFVCSRGCPRDCGFCVGSSVRDRKYHKRSLKNISQEIRLLVKEQGVQSIIFYDDLLFSSLNSVNDDVIEFCEMIQAISENIVWQLEMRPDIASYMEEKTIVKLFQAGCRQINLGIEKASKKSLKAIMKNQEPDQTIEACRRISKTVPNMRLTGTFIIGGPGETKDDIEELISFSKELDLLFAHFNPLELYPGTRLYENQYGAISHYWFDHLMSDQSAAWNELLYEEGSMTGQVLLDFCSKAYREFYNRREWFNLAKSLLGSHLDELLGSILSWETERLRSLRGV